MRVRLISVFVFAYKNNFIQGEKIHINILKSAVLYGKINYV